MLISGKTRVAGILGAPEQVSLSLSPAIHNAAFRSLGMNWVYLSFGVVPELLGVAIRGLAAAGVQGMNVTMPHKVAALEAMDTLTPQAEAIGALNTVEVVEGRLVGHNTDGRGLVRFVERDLGLALAGRRALVIGAGGSARAAVAGLAAAGVAAIDVVARSPARAELLRPAAGGVPFAAAALEEADPIVEAADVLIHATPVGQKMEPPLIPTGRIRPGAVVVDLVYKPPVTPLVAAARERGAIAHSGLGMLLHQAALAFEIWTGTEPPMEVMSAAALRELGIRRDAERT